ncbi:MAG: METTL5 family protein [Methanobrevibacter sp.]|uniref:METTL5 family protein n=1 Tax=Methanobrevibacter sp. TaxID=66852 RepID=UPI0026E0C531|nr:METTL5 family protein [Methanobrevibacter sp.]MDO5848793.1 METTL5 family protein [Methanobrevibacter sp.]
MKPIKNKKQLEIKLQQIPNHPNPKVELEQYSTPAYIAADILWNAYSLGDILDKNVLDLGCGCGVFTIGSLMLGAGSAIGIDIDGESVDVAESFSEKFKLDNCRFIAGDVFQLVDDFNVDTIFQNPPFGSQKRATRGIDLDFIEKAISFGPDVIYSFHMASTEEFLIDYFSRNNLKITHIFRYEFKIPKIYEFHSKESKGVNVIVIRAENTCK